MPEITPHDWLGWTLWAVLFAGIVGGWAFILWALGAAWRDRAKP